jgi:hypothetical protein
LFILFLTAVIPQAFACGSTEKVGTNLEYYDSIREIDVVTCVKQQSSIHTLSTPLSLGDFPRST